MADDVFLLHEKLKKVRLIWTYGIVYQSSGNNLQMKVNQDMQKL